MRRGRSERGDEPLLSVADVYDEHAAGLLRWFQSRTYSSEVAAELCAETFAVLIESQDRFDPERGSAGAWLWGIGRNLLRRYLATQAVEDRARRRMSLSTPVVSDDDLDAVDDRLDAARLGGPLVDRVDELSPGIAAAVRSRVLEGHPYSVVAQHCGCTVGAARVRVARGLAILAGELDDVAAGEGVRA